MNGTRGLSRLGRLTAIGLAALTLAALTPRTQAAFTNFRRVVDTSDAIPGTAAATFGSFNAPSIDANGVVAFRARSNMGSGEGMYTRDMGLAGQPILRVADKSTQVPGNNPLHATFNAFAAFPRIASGVSIFHGQSKKLTAQGEGNKGVYANYGGSLMTVANNTDAVPQGNGTFDQFAGAPDITSTGLAVFKGNSTTLSNSEFTGVYFRDLGTAGPIKLVTDTAHDIPGTSTPFGSTAPPTAFGNQVVFRGVDNETSPTTGGLMIANLAAANVPNSVQALVTLHDPIPGGTGNFTAIGEELAFDGQSIVFHGSGSGGQQGIYTIHADGSDLQRVADLNSDIPGTGTPFADFTFASTNGKGQPRTASFLAGSDGDVFFLAKGPNGGVGIYGLINGTVQTIIDTSDNGGLLDPAATGFEITSLGLERSGFVNGRLVFSASMTDPQDTSSSISGIYMLAVPEPTSILLLAAAAAVLLPWHRRRTAR